MTQSALARRRMAASRKSPTPCGPSQLLDRAAAVLSPANILLVAIWLGISTGLAELAICFVRWRFLDFTALSALQLNQHALWMVPLSHTFLFTACGVTFAFTYALTGP